MVAIIYLSFFTSILCLALGLGGAYQGFVLGRLVLVLIAVGTAAGALAFFFAVVLSLVRPITNRRSKEYETPVVAVLSLVLGLALLGVGAYGYSLYGSKPMIRDVSTDTDNPPKFIGPIKTVQAEEGMEFLPNTTIKRGYDVMDGIAQASGYSNIKPVEFRQARDVVYEAALIAAKTSPGWTITFEQSWEFHFEAEIRSETFRFMDDLVAEVRTGKENKSILQVRSRSRVGLFDLGVNAARIKKFIAKVTEKVPQIAERKLAQ